MILNFKHRLVDIYFFNSNTVLKAKIEIITIVDLITTVAGVPGLLLLISSKLLHRFEMFYTDLMIYKSFYKNRNGNDDDPLEDDSQKKPSGTMKLKHTNTSK